MGGAASPEGGRGDSGLIDGSGLHCLSAMALPEPPDDLPSKATGWGRRGIRRSPHRTCMLNASSNPQPYSKAQPLGGCQIPPTRLLCRKLIWRKEAESTEDRGCGGELVLEATVLAQPRPGGRNLLLFRPKPLLPSIPARPTELEPPGCLFQMGRDLCWGERRGSWGFRRPGSGCVGEVDHRALTDTEFHVSPHSGDHR